MDVAKRKDNLNRWIAKLNKTQINYLDKKYRHFNINGIQHAFLTVTCRNPGIEQKQLFASIGEGVYPHPSNVTRNLIALEKEGYITRSRNSKDKRVWNIYPTEKSLAVYQEVLDTYDSSNERLVKGFTEEEKALLYDFMERMANNIENE